MPADFDVPFLCSLCPRLEDFRQKNQIIFPDFYNGSVPSFGSLNAPILIVGLAPGLKGANATGRPFTGDYAGDLLYQTLLKFNLAKGAYEKHPQDTLRLNGVRITNCVRCVPPANKPTTHEIKTCGQFLKNEIHAMKNLTHIFALGSLAHQAVLRVLDLKISAFPFFHNSCYILPNDHPKLVSSYHCSRYNTQTKRLTQEMFEDVFIKHLI